MTSEASETVHCITTHRDVVCQMEVVDRDPAGHQLMGNTIRMRIGNSTWFYGAERAIARAMRDLAERYNIEIS